MSIKIKTALISVYNKDGLAPILQALNNNNVKLISTGGTYSFIKSLNIPCISVSQITDFPEILDGRVKTLHPKIMGGILARRNELKDEVELTHHQINEIDLVIVDLYPFQQTIDDGASNEEIIEKIDIGGISLIRAAAKNYQFTTIVPSINEYANFLDIYTSNNGSIPIEKSKELAFKAFTTSSQYDNAIQNWFAGNSNNTLRYGENPHQKASFNGNLKDIFTIHQGKDLSYNNLLDLDSALGLLTDFNNLNGCTFIIVKHNNACGIALRSTVYQAYIDALACDNVSAFGGVLVSNKPIDEQTAKEINPLFFEVLAAPSFEGNALQILNEKKNRIIISYKNLSFKQTAIRTVLNGELIQERNTMVETEVNLTPITKSVPTAAQNQDLLFALKIVKHTKSNTIVLVKNNQLLASGTGQTSRVDALNQAIEKATRFGFDLQGAVMASDAFFPFPDCVEIADKAGISAIVQPGGSIRDNDSIAYCNNNDVAMVSTGIRHFKH